MSPALRGWAPAVVLGAGALLTAASGRQRTVALREPLETAVPARIGALGGRDLTIGDAERRVAGMDDYVLRAYAPAGAAAGAAALTLYAGYYRSQAQGRTIHSPRNCLPGSGWEILSSGRRQVRTAAGAVEVNRSLLQHGSRRAVVLYWYQGRGRVTADEYAVKWNLLRDAALHGRTEEALVRVVVPVERSEAEADRLADDAARAALPGIERALPATG